MEPKQHLILGICGGIAAYKVASLLRLLTAQGIQVRVMMTANALTFITPTTLRALGAASVYTNFADCEDDIGHIELARWGDSILIAPATAHTIAKLAHGLADDLLSTTCLASTAPVYIAPAMNAHMWHHPATQLNINTLVARGAQILGPEHGTQACGEEGLGRMMEPERIVSALTPPQILTGKTMVITAGPTREAIDPVRYISNRSSGKMGFALAHTAQRLGAAVIVIAGSTTAPPPPGVRHIHVESAHEMYEATLTHALGVDMFIGAAAVADYRLEYIAQHKIKKSDERITLSLCKNPDIIASIARHPNRPKLVIGFAAETDNLITHAEQKLRHKNLDMIIANPVGDGMGFDQDDNTVTLIDRQGSTALNTAAKSTLAYTIFTHIHQRGLL
jgi:phosphopantothenoylcysteine decarboxylase / phosphopantothenate---cysteine ligase